MVFVRECAVKKYYNPGFYTVRNFEKGFIPYKRKVRSIYSYAFCCSLPHFHSCRFTDDYFYGHSMDLWIPVTTVIRRGCLINRIQKPVLTSLRMMTIHLPVILSIV